MGRSNAVIVSPDLVASGCAGSFVPSSYFVGTGKHETAFAVNEVDTEVSGFRSYGIFQVSDEELAASSYSDADVCNAYALPSACEMFVQLAETRAHRLAGYVNKLVSNAPRDLWAYLALYHNQGWGAVQKTLDAYGMDWGAYKARNPGASINSYGDDCMPSDDTPSAPPESPPVDSGPSDGNDGSDSGGAVGAAGVVGMGILLAGLVALS